MNALGPILPHAKVNCKCHGRDSQMSSEYDHANLENHAHLCYMLIGMICGAFTKLDLYTNIDLYAV